MDGGLIALFVILGVQFAVVAGMVTYLLYRRQPKKKPKLKPDNNVITSYEDPHGSNGDVLIDIDEKDPNDIPGSSTSSSPDPKKKLIDEDEIVPSAPMPEEEHAPPYTVVDVDNVDEDPVTVVVVSPSKEAPPLASYPDQDTLPRRKPESSSSSSSSSDEEVQEYPISKTVAEKPIDDRQPPFESSTSSEPSSESDVDEGPPLIVVPPLKEPVESSSSSSSSSSSEDDEPKPVLRPVIEEKSPASSSSSSDSEKEAPIQKVPIAKERKIKRSVAESTTSEELVSVKKTSDHSSYDEEVVVLEEGPASVSSGDGDAVVDKQRTRVRRKIIRNKEIIELIEEENIVIKKHKKVSNVTREESSSSSSTSSSEEEQKIKKKKKKRKTKKIQAPPTSSSSSSESPEEEDVLITSIHKEVQATQTRPSSSTSSVSLPDAGTREIATSTDIQPEVVSDGKSFSTEYYYDVTNKEQGRHITTTIIERTTSPNRDVTKHHVVRELVKEDVHTTTTSTATAMTTSESDDEVQLHNVAIGVQTDKVSSSSSSSSSEDEIAETRVDGQTQTHSVSTLAKDFDKKVEIEQEKKYTSSVTTTVTKEPTVEPEPRRKSRADIRFTSGWKRQVTLDNLYQAGIVTETTVTELEKGQISEAEVEKSLQMYLVGNEPIAGLIMEDTGEKISIFDAYKMGLIRRGTSISLLEAQAATGRIIDPRNANRMSVKDASQNKIIDRQFEAVLTRAERAVIGYRTRSGDEMLSLFEAMNRGLVVENHGIRLLEAQIATGGIVDPKANHRLPVEVAFERGLFDERLHEILEDPSDDTRGFFDPNTEENLTYLELMERCIIDEDTGLRLLPFKTKTAEKVSKTSEKVVALSVAEVVQQEPRKPSSDLDEGKLVVSEISKDVKKDQELSTTVVTTEEVIVTTTTTQEQRRKSRKDIHFLSGWNRRVTLEDLYQAGVVNEATIEKLEQGEIEQSEVEKSLEQYLVGAEPIAGLLMSDTGDKISIYDAWKQGLIRRGTSISLLEAQAATGRIIDPKTAERMSVQDASENGVIDRQFEAVLTRAERAVIGYRAPGGDETLSLFEAMNRGLVVENHGIRLLEAQIATGGIVDPKANHRLPVEVAFERGLFDERLHDILEDPSDDTRGFFDPNTEENLTYLELMERCIIDEDTGLRLLPFKTKTAEKVSKTSEEVVASSVAEVVQQEPRKPSSDLDEGKLVVSEISKDVKKDQELSTTVVTTEEVIVTTTTTQEQRRKSRKDIHFLSGWNRRVTLEDLYQAGVVNEATIEKLEQGEIEQSEVEKSLEQYLVGAEPIAGLLMSDTGDKISIYDAWKQGLIRRGTSISLLEAQAATGRIIDPKTAERMSVHDACENGVIDRQFEAVLTRAERAVIGYRARGGDETLSLFEAMNRGLVVENHGIRLLEAQIATGGIVDPKANHRLPVEVAFERGLFDERLHDILEDPSDDTRGFFDPNTEENLTYLELMERCVIDQETGLRLLPFRVKTAEKVSKASEEVVTTNVAHVVQQEGRARTSSSSSSSSDEEKVVVSKITEETKKEQDPSTTVVTTEEMIVTTTTQEKRRKSRKDIHFMSGWKRQVTLDDLFKAGVVTESTIEKLEEGEIEQSVVEKSLEQYLVGAEPIAGLLMSDTGDKMSIYEAWKQGLIRRGTSISLLEAQAATGRIIDPQTAERMSVQEASEKRVIDRQFEAVLTRAERAVYGYKTRLSKETLSLFAAMKRGLVVENHGVRLLEAQIATGGIIDPNANHRLPVEVAFERGLFDERLHNILEDPSDDTRGFFDPNTEENLTYLELMERCVVDKDTGLRLLPFRVTRSRAALKHSKVVFESATKRQVLLADLLAADLLDSNTAQKYDEGLMTTDEVKDMVAHLKVYVDGTMPIAGIISSTTGEKMSIVEASRGGLIRKGTAFELLEAQAACGKIMDVQSGKSVSLETAIRIGVIDSEFEDVVSRAHRAVTGYREPFKREVLSLCDAMARHLVVERHAIRLLEAQIATGGIVDIKSPVRISVQVALKRGMIDSGLAKKLERRETTSYFDPMTGENLNYSELMGRCVLDKDSNLLFLMTEGGTVTQNVRPFEPEPDSKKIREKAQAKLTTEVVETKKRKKRRSRKGEPPALAVTPTSSSPPPPAIPSSPPAILSRRVVIVDPNTGNEMTVQEALKYKLIDEDTAKQLIAQEGDFEEEKNATLYELQQTGLTFNVTTGAQSGESSPTETVIRVQVPQRQNEEQGMIANDHCSTNLDSCVIDGNSQLMVAEGETHHVSLVDTQHNSTTMSEMTEVQVTSKIVKTRMEIEKTSMQYQSFEVVVQSASSILPPLEISGNTVATTDTHMLIVQENTENKLTVQDGETDEQ